MEKRKKITLTILSIIYSTFIIIGNSFIKYDSFKLIEKYPILNIIFYIILIISFYFILKKIFNLLESKKQILPKLNKFKKTKIYKTFDKHPFLFSLIFMLLCYLPYIISFYPAILSPDPSYQIKQYFKIPNKYSTYSVMLDPNVTITNHHPVIHTLLLGTCVKIGTLINNVNLGLFIYSIIQILTLTSTLAYTIKFLKNQNINNNYLLLMLLVYSLVPAFPFYSMSAVKDVIFTSLIILYITKLYEFIKTDEITISNIIKTFILMILIILFRNNGIHTLALSFPFLLLLKKTKKYKYKIITLIILFLGFNYTYNNIILPYFKITPTSIR